MNCFRLFQIPLTNLVKTRAILYSTLCATFIISLILSFTNAGFPYSGSIVEPRVQRHYITHTQRTFYDADGDVRFTDIGFFIKENERNTKRTLDLILDPETLQMKNDDVMCKTEAFCGFPNYNATNAFWLKAVKPPSLSLSTLTLTSKTVNGNSVEMNFDVVGTYLTMLFVTTEDGVKLTDTSVGFGQYEWIEGKVANYLRIVNGKASLDPFSFSLKLDAASVANGSDLVKVTIVTFDWHFEKSPMTEEFQKLYNKFPDYTFVQIHQADVSSFTFK